MQFYILLISSFHTHFCEIVHALIYIKVLSLGFYNIELETIQNNHIGSIDITSLRFQQPCFLKLVSSIVLESSVLQKMFQNDLFGGVEATSWNFTKVKYLKKLSYGKKHYTQNTGYSKRYTKKIIQQYKNQEILFKLVWKVWRIHCQDVGWNARLCIYTSFEQN